jgi:8-oxo-dGTP pyrophosphatase MutT (NUDIX family)
MEPGKTAGQIALQEAWEEAGLVGVLDPEPVGSYVYDKWGTTCHVTVFILRVTVAAEEWPERATRERTWLDPARALAWIEDDGLRQVLRGSLKGDRIKWLHNRA